MDEPAAQPAGQQPDDAQPGRRLLEVRRLGRTPYADTYALQKELVEQRVAGRIGDQLILTEHEPVVTLGRAASRELVAGVAHPIYEIERGGEATYHGPGQLVAYPILALPEGRRDLHRYLRDLEEVVIGMLAELEVEGSRKSGLTGVWIGDKKVCSIGVAVRQWVTWHGFALNIRTDSADFRGFKPCGLEPERMTRLCDHTELPPTFLLMEVLAVKHVCAVFDLELPPIPRAPAPEAGRFPDLPILPS